MDETNNQIFDNHENYMELGYNISYYRKRKGMTQEQLAEKLGISRQHMGAIEAPNIHRPPSLELLFNIAAVLEVEPYKFFIFHS